MTMHVVVKLVQQVKISALIYKKFGFKANPSPYDDCYSKLEANIFPLSSPSLPFFMLFLILESQKMLAHVPLTPPIIYLELECSRYISLPPTLPTYPHFFMLFSSLANNLSPCRQ